MRDECACMTICVCVCIARSRACVHVCVVVCNSLEDWQSVQIQGIKYGQAHCWLDINLKQLFISCLYLVQWMQCIIFFHFISSELIAIEHAQLRANGWHSEGETVKGAQLVRNSSANISNIVLRAQNINNTYMIFNRRHIPWLRWFFFSWKFFAPRSTYPTHFSIRHKKKKEKKKVSCWALSSIFLSHNHECCFRLLYTIHVCIPTTFMYSVNNLQLVECAAGIPLKQNAVEHKH